jgi:P-type Ca2+ transporter type 2C
VVLNEHSKENEMYDILAEFPFDSDRKRMSRIVKFKDQHFLLTKGADNVMIPRCSMKPDQEVNV